MTLLTLGITAFTVQLENAAVSATRKKQEIIKEALSAYLARNKRLPCPDITTAVGNVPGRGDDNRATAEELTTACSSAIGVVPYIDLGLPRDAAFDGWENYYTYRVTTDADPTLDWTRSTNFAAGKPGKLRVDERNPATNATLTRVTNPATENAVVVLVSHGRNGLGATTILGTPNLPPIALTDEAENADGTTNFDYIRREQTDIAVPTYGAYDDIVTYMKASDLIAPLVKDGSLRTPEGETAYVMTKVVSSIIGASMVAPPVVPATYTMERDGWGTLLAYTPSVGAITTTSSGPAFTVSSYGPDRQTGGAFVADDVLTTVTASELKTLYAKAGITVP